MSINADTDDQQHIRPIGTAIRYPLPSLSLTYDLAPSEISGNGNDSSQRQFNTHQLRRMNVPHSINQIDPDAVNELREQWGPSGQSITFSSRGLITDTLPEMEEGDIGQIQSRSVNYSNATSRAVMIIPEIREMTTNTDPLPSLLFSPHRSTSETNNSTYDVNVVNTPKYDDHIAVDSNPHADGNPENTTATYRGLSDCWNRYEESDSDSKIDVEDLLNRQSFGFSPSARISTTTSTDEATRLHFQKANIVEPASTHLRFDEHLPGQLTQLSEDNDTKAFRIITMPTDTTHRQRNLQLRPHQARQSGPADLWVVHLDGQSDQSDADGSSRATRT